MVGTQWNANDKTTSGAIGPIFGKEDTVVQDDQRTGEVQSNSCSEIGLGHIIIYLVESFEYLFYFVLVNSYAVVCYGYFKIVF